MLLWVEYYEKFQIDVPENAIVYDVKEQIENTLGIPLQNQILYFSTVYLDNDFAVDSYGIQSDDQLDLYVMRSFTIAHGSTTYTVDISDEELVGDLAKLVGQKIGISEANFMLCWEEQILDDKTIREYKIPENGAVVRAMPKMELIIQGARTLYTFNVCGFTTVARLKNILEDAVGLNKATIQLKSPANSTDHLGDDVTMSDCGINGLDNNMLLLDGDD